nr:MAG TPA: hypothetical protein [Caudoviricetes sp.]
MVTFWGNYEGISQHLTRFGGFLFLFSTRLKFWTVPE